MKQTAVEWLAENIDNLIPYVNDDSAKKFNELVQQAKEMENQQQGYSEEDLECAWNSSDQNMRFQFSSSAYKAITFKQWLEKFKEEKQL